MINSNHQENKAYEPSYSEVMNVLAKNNQRPVPIWKPSKFKKFTRMFGDGAMLIAKDEELPREVLRVYLALFSCLDYGNEINLTQAEIAEQLGVYRPSITKAFSVMYKKGILLKGSSRGKCTTYFLNPEYGFKGSEKNWWELWEKDPKFSPEFRLLAKNLQENKDSNE